MSGLYNMMFPGSLERADALCAVLEIDPDEVDRIRDGLIDIAMDGNPLILIVTRTGGPNWEDHETSNLALLAHPDCVDNQDWDFDRTYHLFWFKINNVDPEFQETIRRKAPTEPIDMTARFNEMLARINPTN